MLSCQWIDGGVGAKYIFEGGPRAFFKAGSEGEVPEIL